MGEKILTLGEKLDPAKAELVFARFQEIISQADQDTTEITSLTEDPLSTREVEEVKFNLLRQGRNLLADCANKVERSTELDEKEILSQLSRFSAELTLTASVYKTLSRSRKLRPEDIKGVSFEIRPAHEISNNAEIEAMIDIYRENFAPFFVASPRFEEDIINGFRAKFNTSSKTTLMRYQKNNQLLAFLRIDDIDENTKYFGSFNAGPKGSSIGLALLRTMIERVGGEYAIEVYVVKSETEKLKMYQKYGFEVVGEELNYHDTGIDLLKIKRPATKAPAEQNESQLISREFKNAI